MKINNPASRWALSIRPKDRVLDVGGGNHPHPRANVIVDKYEDDDTHRNGNLKVYRHQEFINADGESLPFEDNAFDYVICCHVMEHVPHPDQLLHELSRVSKRGYIEVPSLLGEFLAPKDSHEWVSLEIDNKIVCVRKNDIGMNQVRFDFGELFLYQLQKQSLAYKLLLRTEPNLMTVRYEWQDEIEVIVDPQDERLRRYFTTPWGQQQIMEQFPKRQLPKEMLDTCKAFFNLCKTYVGGFRA
ncbi:class I SAM-dependent methyltransferase [Algivirga pacifica]|uniref:Methyltransferase type 11 domain-containing protein n=1 Tax=Algivirga pacifica TaxID=1162670 RepID=A0ABP9DDV9_9BACT